MSVSGMSALRVTIVSAAGLSMLEQEKQWKLTHQGRGHEYHGVAVHPTHLSLFERAVLKRHKQHKPERDAQALQSELVQSDLVHTGSEVA